ncbi:hypothetical protein AMTR_s00075p00173870, partial [Amborella trichopoda]
TCSILLRSGELAPTHEDVTQILGVRSEGEPFLSIPLGMSTSHAFDSKELLGIPLEKIRGRHDSEIRLGKLVWEFTGVPHCARRLMGGRAPQVLVSVSRRPSHKGKAPVEEDGAGASELVQEESEVFWEKVDLTIDHGPFLDSEIYSLWAFLAYLFGEFLYVDRSKGRAHLLVVWATRWLDYFERVAWGPATVGWLHYHLCSVVRLARYLGRGSIFL